mmetsp:Transcript_41835/g.125014  ORF Transcript_41835/g.125014 Transcript_41835/m.125014 type:complete len:200 (+) Transcript_41835:319-918(+)
MRMAGSGPWCATAMCWHCRSCRRMQWPRPLRCWGWRSRGLGRGVGPAPAAPEASGAAARPRSRRFRAGPQQGHGPAVRSMSRHWNGVSAHIQPAASAQVDRPEGRPHRVPQLHAPQRVPPWAPARSPCTRPEGSVGEPPCVCAGSRQSPATWGSLATPPCVRHPPHRRAVCPGRPQVPPRPPREGIHGTPARGSACGAP